MERTSKHIFFVMATVIAILLLSFSAGRDSFAMEASPESQRASVVRLAGKNRFETAYEVAEELLIDAGETRFERVILAYSDDYADALAGSSLAAYTSEDMQTPILLMNKASTKDILSYVEKKVVPGGTVYLLGGNRSHRSRRRNCTEELQRHASIWIQSIQHQSCNFEVYRKW